MREELAMSAGKVRIPVILAAVLLVAACGNPDGGPQLMNLRSPHEGPDEFAILPTKPLQIPSDLKTLPEPQPGGANLVDPDPLADAVIALGGRPGAGSTDAALVAAAGRNGVSSGIREELAEEDAAFRERNKPRLLERLTGSSTYHRAYSGQTTSARGELERWRAIDARTPAAPPRDAR